VSFAMVVEVCEEVREATVGRDWWTTLRDSVQSKGLAGWALGQRLSFVLG
jgi:hypothetical protein